MSYYFVMNELLLLIVVDLEVWYFLNSCMWKFMIWEIFLELVLVMLLLLLMYKGIEYLFLCKYFIFLI